MCIFSGPVKSVSSTSIFVKDRGNSFHACVYKMVVDLMDAVAMVLPVPTMVGSGDDALKFIDLSGFPDFFDVIDKLFPAPIEAFSFSASSLKGGADRSILKVHDVGDYEASYVPSLREFSRLDQRFRLPDGVWDRLPDYSNFGFAVFQLKRLTGSGGGRKFHPMAFEYQPNDPTQLHFPTVHVHDGGDVPNMAHFDHSLYTQNGGQFRSPIQGWDRSEGNPPHDSHNKSHGLLSLDEELFRFKIGGERHNRDTVLNWMGSMTNIELREPAVEAEVIDAGEDTKTFCTQCGKGSSPDANFCGNCGTKL